MNFKAKIIQTKIMSSVSTRRRQETLDVVTKGVYKLMQEVDMLRVGLFEAASRFAYELKSPALQLALLKLGIDTRTWPRGRLL